MNRLALALFAVTTVGCGPPEQLTPTPLDAFDKLLVTSQLRGSGNQLDPKLAAFFGGAREGDECVLGGQFVGRFGELLLRTGHLTQSCDRPMFGIFDEHPTLFAEAQAGGELVFSDENNEVVLAFEIAPFAIAYAPTDAVLYEDPGRAVPDEFIDPVTGLLPSTPVWLDIGVAARKAQGLVYPPYGSDDEPVRIDLELNGAGTAVRLAAAELYDAAEVEYPATGGSVAVDFLVEPGDDVCQPVVGDVACRLSSVAHTVTVETAPQ